MGGDSKLGEDREGFVACKDLGGFSLDSDQAYQKIWFFPCLVGLDPLNPLDLLHRDGKLRHMGGSFAAAPYLSSSLITRLRDGSCSLSFLWDTIPSFNPC